MVKHVTGQGVRTRDDRDASIVKRFQQAKHRRERIMIGRLFALWNFERSAQHRPPNLRRETWHDVLKPWSDYGRIPAKQPFENVHGRIEHSLMLLEKRNELADFRFVRREFARELGDLDKAVAIARLLHFGEQKIQFDKVEVLDFISATLDELAR